MKVGVTCAYCMEYTIQKQNIIINTMIIVIFVVYIFNACMLLAKNDMVLKLINTFIIL